MLAKTLRVAAILATGGLMSAAVFTCNGSSLAGTSTPIIGARPAFALSNDSPRSIANVAERVVDSVVNISSEKVVDAARHRGGPFNDPLFRQFFGQGPQGSPRQRHEKSLGSGVIVSNDGIVLTNNHVIEGATNVRVTLADGRELDAKILGTDPQSDLGVLQLQDAGDDIKPLEFGDSDGLRLGEVVLAVGNPFGVGQTVTMGIVSAKGRANVGIVDYEDFIQTDAAINPGNSGGALVDSAGRLIGINTAILSRSGGYQGIGFAIPAKMAQSILDSLLQHGKVVRGWLGVAIQEVNRDLAEALELDDARGVLIADVLDDGPAAAAGLTRGDVVTEIDGQAVDSVGRLRNVIATAGANRPVELTIVRNKKRQMLSVELGAKPDSPEAISKSSSSNDAPAGLTLGDLDSRSRQRFALPGSVREGALVLSVERGSRAARGGIRPGDLILQVGHGRVASAQQATEALRAGGGNIAILIRRGNNTLFLALPASPQK